MLQVQTLSKSYGAMPALTDVDFAVTDGETLAVIGPNGAGKTTLFKCITGEILPDQGSVRYRDEDITTLPAFERVKLGFGRTFQVARVFPNYTVSENIVVAIEARMRRERVPRAFRFDFQPTTSTLEEADQMAGRVNLGTKVEIQARFLSHGDKKRLEIAIMLAGHPKILMMDEPTAGMSPMDRQQTVELIRRIREEYSATIMMTEHDMDVVFGLANRLLVLNYGRVIAAGDPAEVRANEMVREVYLGEELADA